MKIGLVIDYLVYVIVRILICIVQAMRIETGERFARGMAWFFSDVLRIRGKVVGENLAHAFPDMTPDARTRLQRRMWEHLFLLVLEVAHSPRKIHETNWREFISLKNEAELVRDLLDDRPTLIVTAHLGNFEVGGFVLGILGFPTYTIARTLDNQFLDRFLNDFRGKTGQHIIPKNGGYDRIVEVLSAGGAMTFLADQYAGAKGCWVEFFGRPASAPQGDRTTRAGAQREGFGLCFPAKVEADAIRNEQSRNDRSERRRQFAEHDPRAYTMVHQPARRTGLFSAEPILVAAPAMERHATAEKENRKAANIGRADQ